MIMRAPELPLGENRLGTLGLSFVASAADIGGRWNLRPKRIREVQERPRLAGRSDCLYGRILSTIHNEIAASDPGGAIGNEESDDLCEILRNAHSPQRNRGSHGLRGNAKSLRKVGTH